MVHTGGRRAAACASFFGLRSPKVSSRLTCWPEAISNASMCTFWSLLKRNPLIPCQSLASANKGSTHTLRLRSACSLKAQCTTTKTRRQILRHFDEEYVDRVKSYRGTFFYEKASQVPVFAR